MNCLNGCDKPRTARGLCNACYLREYRANNPEYRERENKKARERFANNPDVRARRAASVSVYQRERRANDPEYRAHKNDYMSAWHREKCANDPEYLARLRERRREQTAIIKAARELGII